MKVTRYALTLLIVTLSQTASAANKTGLWLGGTDKIKSIEFRESGEGIWNEYHNGKLESQYKLEDWSGGAPQWAAKDPNLRCVQLHDASRDIHVQLWPDRAEATDTGTPKFKRLCRGGWKLGNFEKKFGIRWRYYGNYGGAGNKGGRPVDAFDRACQRHDLGTARRGDVDSATDARFVVDSGAAALNPFNDVGFAGRAKAVGASALFAAKVASVDVPVAVVTAPVKVITHPKKTLKRGIKRLRKLF
jgi:hypothetical protein